VSGQERIVDIVLFGQREIGTQEHDEVCLFVGLFVVAIYCEYSLLCSKLCEKCGRPV